MDLCQKKNSELEPQFQKYKGMLRGDIVKDDSGAYAVFTERGSSASQMTAAKVMVVIAPLPDCDGQATDAVSVYTQVKMEDAQKLLKYSKNKNVRIYGHDFQNINGRSRGIILKILLFLLNETCTDTYSQDSCGKDNLKKH